MAIAIFLILPLILGWIADRRYGDPERLPHLIVFFGKVVSWGDKHFNCGKNRKRKGALFVITLILGLLILGSL